MSTNLRAVAPAAASFRRVARTAAPRELDRAQRIARRVWLIALLVLPIGSASAQKLPGDRMLRSATSGNDGERCEALLVWVARLASDKPTTEDDPERREPTASAALLYRDEDFIQVFGKRFDALAEKDRIELFEKRIARCTDGDGKDRTYSDRFRPYGQAIRGPLIGRGYPNGDSTRVVVTRAREMRAWLMSTVASVATVPATKAGFDQLRELRASPRARDRALWPSERQYLRQAIVGRLRVIAGDIVAAAIAEPPLAAPTMADLTAMTVLQSGPIEDVFEYVADQQAVFDRYQLAYQARVDTTMLRAISPRLAAIEATPATLAGARTLAQWKTGLDAELRPFANRPAMATINQRYGVIRQRVLTGALPAWKSEVDSLPATGEGAAQIGSRLAQLFPFPSDRSLPIYAIYSEPFKKRNDLVTEIARLEAEEKALKEKLQVTDVRIGSEGGWPPAGRTFSSAQTWYSEWTAAPRVSGRDLLTDLKEVALSIYTSSGARLALVPDSLIRPLVRIMNGHGIQVRPAARARLEVRIASQSLDLRTDRGNASGDVLRCVVSIELPARIIRGGGFVPIPGGVARIARVDLLGSANRDAQIAMLEKAIGDLLAGPDSFEGLAADQPSNRESLVKAAGGIAKAFASYRRPFPPEYADTGQSRFPGLTAVADIDVRITTSVYGMDRKPVVPEGAEAIEVGWRRRLGQEGITVGTPGAPIIHHTLEFLGSSLFGAREAGAFVQRSVVTVIEPECLIEHGDRLVIAACLSYHDDSAPASVYEKSVLNFAREVEAQRSELVKAMKRP